MNNLNIALVGGGIGGLTLAIALQREGFRPRIYERTDALAEVGAGLTLAANAMRAYDYIGLGDAIRAVADCPKRAALRDFVSGALLRDLELARSFQQIHRADMLAILVKAITAIDQDSIQLGCEFDSLESTDSVRARFTSGRKIEADLLVGCDGNRSAVRQALFGPDRAEYLNYVAWRGLVPAAAVQDVISDYDTGSYVGSGRSLVRYRIRGGRLVNYVAFAHKTEWTSDSWSLRSSVEEMEREFGGGSPDVMSIIRATPADASYKWGLIGRPPLPEWTRGRVTLLGDAAHPMLPFLGQGAGMAIEDAVLLARALAASKDPVEALSRYEAARRPRCKLVTQGARHAGFRMHGIDDGETSDAARTYTEAFVADYDPATAPL